MTLRLDRLDRRGIAEIAKSPEVAREVHARAEQIANSARGSHPDADIVVDDYVTDRAASSVTIRDARGALWQAQDGVLTRAAAGAGLEVKERRA